MAYDSFAFDFVALAVAVDDEPLATDQLGSFVAVVGDDDGVRPDVPAQRVAAAVFGYRGVTTTRMPLVVVSEPSGRARTASIRMLSFPAYSRSTTPFASRVSGAMPPY